MPAIGKSATRRFATALLCSLLAICSASPPQSAQAAPIYEATIGKIKSIAVPVGENLLVTVFPTGHPAGNAVLTQDGNRVSAGLAMFDPVSRLAFFRCEGKILTAPWLREITGDSLVSLRLSTGNSILTTSRASWVKQVNGKILPLALLKIDGIAGAVSPGCPVIDGNGKIAAVIFQSAAGHSSIFAIPADAVNHLLVDFKTHRKPMRGWTGMSFSPGIREAKVRRVIAGSPAETGGILSGDVISDIGSRPITRYADIADAFFYLSPGKPVTIGLIRSGKSMRLEILPVLRR